MATRKAVRLKRLTSGCMMAFYFIFLTCAVSGRVSSLQRFDGWYNNLAYPSWGSAGERLLHNITTEYSDYTYQPSGQTRPSPRLLSNLFFKKNSSEQLSLSQYNRTAMFPFFGQLVTLELLDTDDTTCPVELLKIPVPTCDEVFDPQCQGNLSMPYERIVYDKNTGQSPNAPRQQINKATSYIDGSFVYGTSTVRASFLYDYQSGKLESGDVWGKFPKHNDIGLPYVNYPTPTEHKLTNPETLWKLGDPHVYENPALLSLSLLFFRYHNYLADTFQQQHEQDWTAEKVFGTSRRWVIATLQNIIMYDWLPKLLNSEVEPYTGYKSHVQPGVSGLFDAAAIRYIMTLIPPGISQRSCRCDPVAFHNYKAMRLCNSYWKSQDLVMEREEGLDEILMGLVSQIAEREDMAMVEDIQSKSFGPLHFSRHDAIAQIIMKGRDYGLPDYNTVRKQMGLKPIQDWGEINPELYNRKPEIFEQLRDVYGNLSSIDVFVGGMLETSGGAPGPLFSMVIRDQFLRIRDADRFWFENKDNGIFTEAEIEKIRNTTLYDVILKSTKVLKEYIQKDVFTWREGDTCSPDMLSAEDLEPCTPHRGFDYFAGSEIAYILVWIAVGLIPFICVLVAYILAKCKQLRHRKTLKRLERQVKNSFKCGDLDLEGSNFVQCAMEWLGEKESPRTVIIRVKPKCIVEVTSMKMTQLRKVNLGSLDKVEMWLSSNKGRTTVLIKIPKEYDLVLQFNSEQQRSSFQQVLDQTLSSYGKQITSEEMKLKYIRKKAFTLNCRNALLEKFFKSVFSEAFQMDYDPNLDEEPIQKRRGPQEILEIELTKDEFAEALEMKPDSDFVENMFSLLDTNHSDYISFRDFLNAVVLFSKGSCQDKLQTLFRMFDVEGKGCLKKTELIRLFSSLLEMANSSLSKTDVAKLVESICSQNGLDGEDLNFEDFVQILAPQMDNIWDAGLEWKGRRDCYPCEKRKSSDNGRRKNSAIGPEVTLRKFSTNSNMSNGMDHRLSTSSLIHTPEPREQFHAVREKYTPVKARIKVLTHFVENNRQHIFFLVIFFGICIAVFAERFYYYAVEREHSGLRALMGYGICVSRGGAAGMSFTFSLLLLTMARNLITWLRGTFLNLYVPFDSTVAFHKVVAWTALFFTGLHVFGYAFNFYQLATEPTKYLCVLDNIVMRSDFMPSFDFFCFRTVTGFSGILLVLIIYIIYIFATQTARRYIFNAFWLTHKLIILLYVLTILHGASYIVQKPMFYAYFTGPAIIFAVDKMISLSRKKKEITVLRAEKLASDVTVVEFKRPAKFEYKSGMWVNIACIAQGRNEYHPFTLTSAPQEDILSLHIRALGPWTWNFRHTFDPENLKDKPYPKLYLDGPYGAGQQDWYQYEVSVLVGAGIGVTPYASILKDFVYMAAQKSTYKMRTQKLYFIWITGSHRHYEWLVDILRQVEEVDIKGVVSIDIFITKFFQNFDLRTAMLYICEEHFQKLSGGRSVFTGLKAATHFGRPQLNSMLHAVHKAHPLVRKVGVFSCGPPGVTKSVERACADTSKETKAMFEHHFENF